VGRTYEGRDGKAHRPSMLLTVTLPGFGSVHTGTRMRRGQLMQCDCGHRHGEADDLLGTPMDRTPDDYREQALSLIFFPYLLDRLWQNYRCAAGWRVAYAGAVEMQRRLATHAHYAVRGTISPALTKQVAAATYHQVWRPPFDRVRYSISRHPVWDAEAESYVEDAALTTWRQAIEALAQPGAEPAFVGG
jgi:hypothetical protein